MECPRFPAWKKRCAELFGLRERFHAVFTRSHDATDDFRLFGRERALSGLQTWIECTFVLPSCAFSSCTTVNANTTPVNL
jgi:hypothetical protein